MKPQLYLFIIIGLLFTSNCYAQKPEDTEDWTRKPVVVTPGEGTTPPSDAIILYNNPSDRDKWEGTTGEIKWTTKGSTLEVVKGTGEIHTRQKFGDIQLHIEWSSPKKVSGNGQGRGNSGIFLMGLYEVQVLDSYQNETYYNGQAGSIYKQSAPLVNACRKPGEWQSYDILFTAPRFNPDKTLKSPAYVTVLHNGVLIQNHFQLTGKTLFIGKPEYTYHESRLPIVLQDHGNPVRYRNIWVRDLSSNP
ncbi:MAG: DUF1080 domain-containing protein [Bacteroidota bacterium]|nr:DUF1080 domain-containing protein [Bacteroidota bacterium]